VSDLQLGFPGVVVPCQNGFPTYLAAYLSHTFNVIDAIKPHLVAKKLNKLGDLCFSSLMLMLFSFRLGIATIATTQAPELALLALRLSALTV